MDDELMLLAERVMGWECRDKALGIWRDVASKRTIHDWNPRNNWAHAGMLVERLAEMGYWLHFESPFWPRDTYSAHFARYCQIEEWDFCGATGPAAITEAALALAREMSDSEGE